MTRARDVADTQDNLGGAVPPFTAGKNKIINGDFGIWQRGTSFSASGYTADRWALVLANTVTISQQTFTPGTAPVSGYESTFFARFNRTARPTAFDDYFVHRIEDVRTFAGQTVTLSFWAKSSASTTLSGAYLEHWFGSGGSSSPVYIDSTGPLTLTTSWQRFTKTIAIPSIAGKTIGTNSFLAVTFAMANSAGVTGVYDIWGVQLEAGSVATPFATASGTIGGELALCQRYYEKSYPYANLPGSTTSQQGLVSYQAVSSTAINNRCWTPFIVSKRTDSPTITIYNYNNGASGTALNESTGIYAVAIQFQSNRGFNLYPTNGSFSAGQVCNFYYTAESEL